MATVQTGDNKWAVARYIVDQTPGQGTHTTITAAMADAVSGDVIAVRQGTYTEDFTIVPGVTLTTMGGGEYGGVTVVGRITMSGEGTSTIFGMRLQTNSDFAVVVSGNAASALNIGNCYINCTNNTGISFTSSSALANITINNTYGNIATTGISLFTHTSAGGLLFTDSFFSNTAASTTASSVSAGVLNCVFASFQFPLTVSATGATTCTYTTFANAPTNTIMLTLGGSGIQNFKFCRIESGTATSVTITTSAVMEFCTVDSSNASAISGVGTLTYSNLSFPGMSSTISTSTTVGLTTQSGTLNLKSPLTVANGGSGVASFANTSALLATGTTTTGNLQNIASVATGQVLVSAGTSTIPTWSATPSVTSITLSGGTALANYVQGTYGPTLFGQTTAGVTTYTAQTGYYTRVGNLCYIQGVITASAATGTGNLLIGSFPFTIKNQTNGSAYGSIINVSAGTLALPAGTTWANLALTANTTRSSIFCSGTTSAGGNIQMVNNNLNLQWTAIYQI